MNLRRDTTAKIEIAAKMYDSMNHLKKNVVGQYAKAIFAIQKEINKVAGEVSAGQVCEKCKGGCCKDGVEDAIEIEELLYAMFAMTEEERKKVYEVVNAEHEPGKCSLADKDGCVLPKYARPIPCKAFHCNSIPGGGDIMGNQGKELKKAYAHYVKMVDAMEV